MKSYDSIGIAAEFHMQQLLDEAEHRRMVRSVESGHDHPAPSPSIGTGLAGRFQRLTGRVVGTSAGTSAVQGR